MNNLKDVAITVKILQHGDKVLNVWYGSAGYCVAVQKLDDKVIVYSVSLDENKYPRLNECYPLTVTFGDGEVECIVGEADESTKIITL
jgi:hypothetical protein